MKLSNIKLKIRNYILRLLYVDITIFKIQNTWLVAFYTGKMAVATSNKIIEANDNMINVTVFLVINQYSNKKKVIK